MTKIIIITPTTLTSIATSAANIADILAGVAATTPTMNPPAEAATLQSGSGPSVGTSVPITESGASAGKTNADSGQKEIPVDTRVLLDGNIYKVLSNQGVLVLVLTTEDILEGDILEEVQSIAPLDKAIESAKTAKDEIGEVITGLFGEFNKMMLEGKEPKEPAQEKNDEVKDLEKEMPKELKDLINILSNSEKMVDFSELPLEIKEALNKTNS